MVCVKPFAFLVWLFDEREMNTGVAINALTAEDSYSGAQNWRRHDDGTIWSLLDQSVERGVSFPPIRGNRTFKLFIHFLPLNIKTENKGDFLFLKKTKNKNGAISHVSVFNIKSKMIEPPCFIRSFVFLFNIESRKMRKTAPFFSFSFFSKKENRLYFPFLYSGVENG